MPISKRNKEQLRDLKILTCFTSFYAAFAGFIFILIVTSIYFKEELLAYAMFGYVFGISGSLFAVVFTYFYTMKKIMQSLHNTCKLLDSHSQFAYVKSMTHALFTHLNSSIQLMITIAFGVGLLIASILEMSVRLEHTIENNRFAGVLLVCLIVLISCWLATGYTTLKGSIFGITLRCHDYGEMQAQLKKEKKDAEIRRRP
jgi:hypothetical protein